MFDGNKVYLSFNNPNTGDPTVVQLLNGDRPSGLLLTSTILTDGVTGFDTVTKKIETVPQNDPLHEARAEWRPDPVERR